MWKKNKIGMSFFILSVLLFSGCSGKTNQLSDSQLPKATVLTSPEMPQETSKITEQPQKENLQKPKEAVIIDVDWSNYFKEFNGAAVFYDSMENSYQVYNQELAETRRSPCSTFKIISSLVGLEHGIISPEDSVRKWSGETFWMEEWNQDINFYDAFRYSCVWYFREVIDEIGKNLMQVELDKLQYGNCDISDWEGTLNTNSDNRALTGFWIESSLKISPMEQVKVMEQIFGEQSNYSKETQDQLKQAMLVTERDETVSQIYGKTGMGKAQEIVVDSWFTGFAEYNGKRIYFCVYLGETEHANVSSTEAKKIAIEIASKLLEKE